MTGRLSDFPKCLFKWRLVVPALYYLACVVCFLTLCTGLYGSYLDGTRLDGAGAITLQGIIMMILLVSAGMISIFLAFGLIAEVIWKKLSPLHLLSILVLPVCIFLPYELGIPGFLDGVYDRLTGPGVTDGWVAFAAAEMAKQRAGRSSLPDSEYQDWQQIIEGPPFDKAGFRSIPRIEAGDSSLFLRFGGPMSRRWGIAISETNGKEPTIPSDSFAKRMLTPEVALFDIPNY